MFILIFNSISFCSKLFVGFLIVDRGWCISFWRKGNFFLWWNYFNWIPVFFWVSHYEQIGCSKLRFSVSPSCFKSKLIISQSDLRNKIGQRRTSGPLIRKICWLTASWVHRKIENWIQSRLVRANEEMVLVFVFLQTNCRCMSRKIFLWWKIRWNII